MTEEEAKWFTRILREFIPLMTKPGSVKSWEMVDVEPEGRTIKELPVLRSIIKQTVEEIDSNGDMKLFRVEVKGVEEAGPPGKGPISILPARLYHVLTLEM